MANIISRTPVREQDPIKRAANFEEVCYGFNLEEAQREASRCLHCRNPRCVQACPVSIQIPNFIAAVAAGELQQAADIIAEDSLLPSLCGRVCPQESQCEGSCILGCFRLQQVAQERSMLRPDLHSTFLRYRTSMDITRPLMLKIILLHGLCRTMDLHTTLQQVRQAMWEISRLSRESLHWTMRMHTCSSMSSVRNMMA